MLEKTIYAEDYLETGEPAVRELSLKPGGEIIKTAYRLPAETLKYIKNITPTEGKSFLLINALGASGILYQGGIWGQNRNGDYFAEADLIAVQTPKEATRNPGAAKGIPLQRYKTFENGHFFANHTNKDPNKAIGRILFADYDMDMHRVLLIVEFWRDKDPILAGRLDHDLPISTSMGCKVPGDYCTICDNYSRKPDRSDACIHVKSMVGQIMPDGRRVGMINKSPRFFDISKVFVGADATSKVLMKVASSGWQQYATYSYTMPKYYSVPSNGVLFSKHAEIQKTLPPDDVNGQLLTGLQKLMQAARNREPTIEGAVLDSIPLHSNIEKVGAITGLGFIPHGAELEYLGLNESDLNRVEPFYHEKTAQLLEPYIPYRTIYDPYVSARLLAYKNRGLSKIAGFFAGAGGASPATFVIAGLLYSKIMTALAGKLGSRIPIVSHFNNPLLQLGVAAGGIGVYGAARSIGNTAPRHNTIDSGQITIPENYSITKVSKLYSQEERTKAYTEDYDEMDLEAISKVAYIIDSGNEDILVDYLLENL